MGTDYNLNDFDDYIAEQKDFILEKDCWDLYDASFLMTGFCVEDCNNHENERRRKQFEQLLRSSIVSKKLIPDYDNSISSQKLFLNGRKKKGFGRKGFLMVFLKNSKPRKIAPILIF